MYVPSVVCNSTEVYIHIYIQASILLVWYFIKNSENVTKIQDVDVFNYFFKDLAWFTCFCIAISSSIKLLFLRNE